MEDAGVITELEWHLQELRRDGDGDGEQAEAIRDALERLTEQNERRAENN